MAESKRPPVRQWSQIRVFRELLRAHARVMQRTREFAEKETGFTVTELDMVIELGNQTGLRMGELASRLLVSPANVTRLAQALAEKGLVVRERAEHSEREVLARLTPKGQALFERHFPKAASFMAGLVDEHLSNAEQVKLAELLERLGR